MTRVLFTGGGGAGNEALWRLLSDRYELHFGDADRSAIDPSIPADRRHALPWATQEGFVPAMIELCRRLQIDVLVPGVDEELLHLARARANFGPTSLLLPEADYVAVMLDKLSMVRALDDKGILVPKTVKLDEANADFGFPCISKPRSGRGSRAVRVLETTEDAAALRGTLGLQAGDTILQEKAEGIEYTVQMLANATGKLHAVVPVKVGIKRGITLRAVTDTEPNVTRACLAIHAAMPSSGCYNIQLILTPDGRVIPFEINPRVSTTLCLVVAAGIDPIAIYRDAEARSDLLPFTPQLKLQRHWHNVFSNADTDESR